VSIYLWEKYYCRRVIMTAEDAKKQYYELLDKIIKRDGVKELAAYLERHGFFKAPASTKFHLCSEGGLLIHSVGVAKTALKIKPVLLPSYPDESVILCCLFHDAHKVTDGFGQVTYNKNNGATKDQQPYFWNKNQMAFSGAHKSLLLINKFVDLTREEMQAIAYHDGPYVPSFEDIKGNVYPLTHLIHFADLWSTWVDERGLGAGFDAQKFLDDKETLF